MGQWQGTCVGENLAIAEFCNGLDDDCDGLPDEDFVGQVETCGIGACEVTQENCVAGEPFACVPNPPTAEACNGVDDDCNGEVDDGFADLTCGHGQCQRTVAACVGGVSQVCITGAPSPEICNGLDDDCDGVLAQEDFGHV